MRMLNEAAFTLEEGVIKSPSDGDIGAVFGIGFPPFLGGPFFYMDQMGLGHVVERLEAFGAQHGKRFVVAPLLKNYVAEGRSFYPKS
ncbi:MAG: 3-hydroxyacyl-CoA dehydrogenase family protein [Deinococcales bacterium]